MAKLALINRDKKRRATVKKYAAKRAELLAALVIKNYQMRSVMKRVSSCKICRATQVRFVCAIVVR